MILKIKEFLQRLRKRFGFSPIQFVFRELRKRKVRYQDFATLEIFGYTGEYHTKDYFRSVATLDVWEINSAYQDKLRRNLPGAEIKITDSFIEIKQTPRKYDLIVVDNPMSNYGTHCEHFDLFPDLFRVAKDSVILILDVIPEINSRFLRQYPYIFNEKQLQRRAHFYQTDHPESITFEKMISTYKELGRTNDFDLKWFFFQKRKYGYYLVMKLSKLAPPSI